MGKIFPNLQSIVCTDGRLSQRAVPTTQSKRLQVLNDGVGSVVSEAQKNFLSADSVDETKVNKVNYPVKFLNPVAGSASLPDHKLIFRRGYVVTLLQHLQS